MDIPLWLLVSFFSGAIPTAYVVGKVFKNLDIRKEGSGNVGTTNAFRVLGKKWGILVLVVDFGKGFLPVWLFIQQPGNSVSVEMPLWIGVAAILGHIFTPFLKFKGGKGIATGAGVLCAAFPMVFLTTLLAWLLVFSLTHIVSLSSLIAVFIMFIMSLFLKTGTKNTLIFFFIFLLVVWAHRSNLKRLLRGEEKKSF